MRSLDGTLIQTDRCPCEKRDQDTDTQSVDPVRTQGGAGRPPAQDRGLGRNIRAHLSKIVQAPGLGGS